MNKKSVKTIKNYTSGIEASRSMAMIEEMLVSAGATDFNKSYSKDGTCRHITFSLAAPPITQMFFKLPAKVDQCFKVLQEAHAREQVNPLRDSTTKTLKSQAHRTAWKIIHDWVELQLSMIKLEQIEPIEAFLAYAYDPSTDQTLYERLKQREFKQLTSGIDPL